MGQQKAFCRQIISESSYARKDSVNIDNLLTSRNGNTKTMQPIRITGEPATRRRSRTS